MLSKFNFKVVFYGIALSLLFILLSMLKIFEGIENLKFIMIFIVAFSFTIVMCHKFFGD